MRKPTRSDLQAAIAKYKDGNNPLTVEQATDVAFDLMNKALDDERHDSEILARLEKLNSSYQVGKGTGIGPAFQANAVAEFRKLANERHDAALAQDVANWERNREIIFGAIKAGIAIYATGGSLEMVGAALMPAIAAIQSEAEV
jgi:hypothetical protein